MEQLNQGETVEVIDLMDDPDPIPVGTRGKVVFASQWQCSVKWENGRNLMLAMPEDLSIVRVVQ